MTQNKQSRRKFLKYAGAGAVVVAAAGLGLYEYSQMGAPPSPPSSSTTMPPITTTTGPSATSSEQVIKIGYLIPLTGFAAQQCIWGKRTVDLQVEDFNKAGGIPSGPLKGAKAQVIYADTQSAVDVFQSQGERLITQDKVDILMGGYSSSATTSFLPTLDKYSIPLLTDTQSSGKLCTHGSHWIFRAAFHDGIANKNIFQCLADAQTKTGVKIPKMAVAYENSDFGITGKTAAEDLTKDPTLGVPFGYQVVADIPFDPNATDMTSEGAKIKAANPDWLSLGGSVTTEVPMIQALLKQDVNLKAIMEWGGELFVPAFAQAVGDACIGLAGKQNWNWDLNKPLSKAWDAEFMARYGAHDPEGRFWLPFTVGMKAFEAAGTTDKTAVQSALYGLNIPADELITVSGVKFKGPNDPEAGQNELASGVLCQYFKESGAYNYYTVWPFDLASKDFVYPLPTWEQRGLR